MQLAVDSPLTRVYGESTANRLFGVSNQTAANKPVKSQHQSIKIAENAEDLLCKEVHTV